MKLSDLNGHNGFRLDGIEGQHSAGLSVSGVGDINGDGLADVVMSAQVSGSVEAVLGYVVFGQSSGFNATLALSGLDGNNGFRLDSAVAGAYFGAVVSGAGDVNGDGLADLLLGIPSAGVNGENSGAAFVVFGKALGVDPVFNLAQLDGHNGFRLEGGAAGDHAGCSVSNAGDVNGDGFDDVIIGARGTDPSHLKSAGSSYLVFGKASGFDPTMALSSLDGHDGFRIDGANTGDYFATWVSDAGDINGDGYDDLIVNAPRPYTPVYANYSPGSSYVIFGKASGFSADMDLTGLDGENGFRLDGVALYDSSMSTPVSGAGDINGDGYDDLIVGEAYFHPHGNPLDSNYVVFGKASGFDAVQSLSELDGSNGFRLNGPGGSISSAGDVNGDGYADVLIGDPLAQTTGPAGASFLVYGKASGFDAVVDVFAFNENDGLRLDGVEANDHSGTSVSGAGDVNGDGFDDVIIGAPDAEYGTGSSYVVFGGNFTDSVTRLGTTGNDDLLGTGASDRFVAGDGNDSMIGRGGADVFHGGAGNDSIKVSDLDFKFIDGGSGNDVLHLAGVNLNLDLTALGSHIQGIESICIYGRGDNTLTLTAESLLDLSDTTNTLKVHGNSGDHIELQGGDWVDDGSRGFYHTYTHDDAVLLVGANVMVEFL